MWMVVGGNVGSGDGWGGWGVFPDTGSVSCVFCVWLCVLGVVEC